jgi:hypothetical protein
MKSKTNRKTRKKFDDFKRQCKKLTVHLYFGSMLRAFGTTRLWDIYTEIRLENWTEE